MPKSNLKERKNKGFQSLISSAVQTDEQMEKTATTIKKLPGEAALELAAKAKMVEGVQKIALEALSDESTDVEDAVVDQVDIQVQEAALRDTLQQQQAVQQQQQQIAQQQQLLEEKKKQQQEMEKRKRTKLKLSKNSLLKKAVKAGADPLDVMYAIPGVNMVYLAKDIPKILKKILP